MNSILKRIAEHKQEEIAQAKRLKPLTSLKTLTHYLSEILLLVYIKSIQRLLQKSKKHHPAKE